MVLFIVRKLCFYFMEKAFSKFPILMFPSIFRLLLVYDIFMKIFSSRKSP